MYKCSQNDAKHYTASALSGISENPENLKTRLKFYVVDSIPELNPEIPETLCEKYP